MTQAPEARHPHPAAPAEFKERFSQFLAKMNSSGSSESASQKSSASKDSSVTVYNNFWEAPPQLWKPRVRELDEAEIEAIMVSYDCRIYVFRLLMLECRAAVPLHTELIYTIYASLITVTNHNSNPTKLYKS